MEVQLCNRGFTETALPTYSLEHKTYKLSIKTRKPEQSLAKVSSVPVSSFPVKEMGVSLIGSLKVMIAVFIFPQSIVGEGFELRISY